MVTADDRMTNQGRVVLVRCSIERAPAVMDSERARTQGLATLYFFHGDGVLQAADSNLRREWGSLVADGAGNALVVCETAWSRRCAGPVPKGWSAGSLMIFWDAATGATELCCYGASW